MSLNQIKQLFSNGDCHRNTRTVKNLYDRDVYVNMIKIDEDGGVIGLQVIIEPMMIWLWIGGGIMGIGTLISAWPSRRRKEKANNSQIVT